jgi:hypothetical protein
MLVLVGMLYELSHHTIVSPNTHTTARDRSLPSQTVIQIHCHLPSVNSHPLLCKSGQIYSNNHKYIVNHNTFNK